MIFTKSAQLMLASLADEAFLRYCIAFALIPIVYAVAWLYALVHVPKADRKHFVDEHATKLFVPMFLGAFGAFLVGGFIYLGVVGLFYDRRFSDISFFPFWLVTYLIICVFAFRHVFGRSGPKT